MDTSYFSPTAKEALNSFNLQDFVKAAELFSKAADEYLANNTLLLSAEMRNNQSVSLLQANAPQAAIDCLEGVVEIFEEDGDHHKLGLTYGNLASAYDELKKYDDAIEHCYKAADCLRDSNHREEYTMVMNLLVSIQMKQGKIFDAAGNANLFVNQIPNPTFRQRVLKIVYRIYNFLTNLIMRNKR